MVGQVVFRVNLEEVSTRRFVCDLSLSALSVRKTMTGYVGAAASRYQDSRGDRSRTIVRGAPATSVCIVLRATLFIASLGSSTESAVISCDKLLFAGDSHVALCVILVWTNVYMNFKIETVARL